MAEERDLAGCCGIFCGLCTKYQSKSPSRCIGCRLGEQHSWCSIYMCCVVKKGFETCIECDEYPCERYARRKWGTDKVSQAAEINLEQIRESGLEPWLEEQRERCLLVDELLANYNEGRSMSFYCLACTLMPPDLVSKAINEAKEILIKNRIDALNLKAKAKTVKLVIHTLATERGIDLRQKLSGVIAE